MTDKENKEDERAKEFLSCLGNGKTIYQCEEENDFIDEEEDKRYYEWEME
jgi:hypothetical protein